MSSSWYGTLRRVEKPSPPCETLVFCIHCFQTLGKETKETPRAILVARHICAEALLAKQPATPPPYN